jgi:hypothetical protein
MKIITEIYCPHCRKKQVTDLEDLLEADLFWRNCEFCKRYGLKRFVKRKLTIREWMEALYGSMGQRVMEIEAFLKKQ